MKQKKRYKDSKMMANKELKREDWWIYEGKESREKRNKKLHEIDKPEWRDITKPQHNAQKFIANKEVIEAVNAAIYLRRPLLVTGRPGIGKSTLAKAVAENLGLGKVLSWHITSKSVLEDGLYSYDALARLQNIQIKNDDANNDEISTKIEDYLKLKALGTAFLSKKRRVVLIDEIDKSDRDLPNDLLHIFEEQYFEIEELKRLQTDQPKMIQDMEGNEHPLTKGMVKSEYDFPIIIMTSNDEKEFPPAFLRRCICIKLEMPTDPKEQIDILLEMVEAHFPKAKGNDTILDIIKKFVGLNSDSPRSNDQLLNAIHLILNCTITYDELKDSVLSPIE
jgi:MoxR-like ATPase